MTDSVSQTPFSPAESPSLPASSAGNPSKARYIMIGGFLGAGKTTAVSRLARYLAGQGKRIGLITNDQGKELVDTAMLRSGGFATEEIAGGCFCCRFNSLMEAANRLTLATRPEVFVAEPVGSCTDLVATVTYPLRRIYGDQFQIAPLSVLIDPIRASRILGLKPGKSFSEKVLYIYRKQVEEADLIVINKTDLLTDESLRQLHTALQHEFPRAEVLAVSARNESGLTPWFDRILSGEQTAREVMKMDYQLYGQGEALLGWLNATLHLEATDDFDPNSLLSNLATRLQEELRRQSIEVAHLKMTLSPETGLGGLASINVVRDDLVPELGQSLEEPVDQGQLILNLRAEAAPDRLADAVHKATAESTDLHPGLNIKLEHMEHFRPAQPQPTHRET